MDLRGYYDTTPKSSVSPAGPFKLGYPYNSPLLVIFVMITKTNKRRAIKFIRSALPGDCFPDAAINTYEVAGSTLFVDCGRFVLFFFLLRPSSHPTSPPADFKFWMPSSNGPLELLFTAVRRKKAPTHFQGKMKRTRSR